MKFRVCPELPIAPVGSSQAPTAAVDNSAPYATRSVPTYKSGFAVQTNGATSARVPDPHRKLSLTLPPEAFGRLARLIAEQATCNHFARLKAQVATESLKGDKTLEELAQKFDVQPDQITDWKTQLIERLAQVFGNTVTQSPSPDLKSLHAKIGQLTMEKDFFDSALTKAGLPNAESTELNIIQLKIGLSNINFNQPIEDRENNCLLSKWNPVVFTKDKNNYFAEAIKYGDKYYYRVDGITVAIESYEYERVIANPQLYYMSTVLKLHYRIKMAREGREPIVSLSV